MTFKLSQAEYDELWQGTPQSRQDLNLENCSDVVNVCPSQFGRGYQRSIQLREINLLIINEELHEDLAIEGSSWETEDEVEFGFHLSGTYAGKSTGENFLSWTVSGESLDKDIHVFQTRERLLKVDVHVSPDLLQSFIPQDPRSFPLELQQLLQGSRQEYYIEINTMTSAMWLPLRQMLQCPFDGWTRNIYLEGKCLELIALKLDQLGRGELRPDTLKRLKPDDVDRIYLARDVLIHNLNHPPSLLDLARHVGLNDRKLKQGFREVFGTTVFGYLHTYRMIQAKQLLEARRMNINEVARAVGYTSRSAFYTAFRKKFGVSPKNYYV